MRPPPALLAGLLLATLACDAPSDPRSEPHAQPGPLRVELDERSVIIGDVVERLDAGEYVYLRLSVIHNSATPRLAPHTRLRWVALEGEAPELGERVQVRSLARRSRVWEPQLERDFEVLDYAALLPGS